MNKKTLLIMAVLLSLVTLVIAVAPTMAATENGDYGTECCWPDGLALVVPIGAPVSQPVTMTVFQRSDATPVSNAGIWAFTPDMASALDERIATAKENGELSAADTDWEPIIEAFGTFLGRTDEHGKLTCTFDTAARYRLIAVKAGYVPGRSSIYIGTRPVALALQAPQQAEPGETIALNVYRKDTSAPVASAGIWALTRDRAEAFQAEIAAMKEADPSLTDIDWESLASIYGMFLGRTGDDGTLTTVFEETGGYLLIAVKNGYIPARAGIRIGHQIEGLAIEVQRWAKTDEIVPVHVFGRRSGDPVAEAGVWALTRENADSLRQEIAAMREAGDDALAETDWEGIISLHGTFLGTTDDRGNLEASFSEPGGYALVTWKPGYFPGFAYLIVRAPATDAEAASPNSITAAGAKIRPSVLTTTNKPE